MIASVVRRNASSSTVSWIVAVAPKAWPIGASRIAIRDSSPPIDSSRADASSSGTASRCATSDGIARSRNGTPSRSASRGPTSEPSAPYAAETVTIVMWTVVPTWSRLGSPNKS